MSLDEIVLLAMLHEEIFSVVGVIEKSKFDTYTFYFWNWINAAYVSDVFCVLFAFVFLNLCVFLYVCFFLSFFVKKKIVKTIVRAFKNIAQCLRMFKQAILLRNRRSKLGIPVTGKD